MKLATRLGGEGAVVMAGVGLADLSPSVCPRVLKGRALSHELVKSLFCKKTQLAVFSGKFCLQNPGQHQI